MATGITRPRRAHGLVVIVLVACGPRLVGEDGSAGGSASEGAGSGATASTVDETGDGTASQGLDDTAAPSDGWCLRGVAQPMLEPFEFIIAMSDVDGNGRDEVWVRRPQGDPVQSSRVLAFELGPDELLAPILELEVPGDVWRMVDVDGDGLRDLVLRDETLAASGWLAGQPGLGFDDVPQPLSAPVLSDVWRDINGDGLVDIVETRKDPPAGIVIHLGDGAGGFSSADQLGYEGTLSYAKVWGTGLPGRWLIVFEELTIGFGSDTTTVVSIEVSPSGAITTLAQGDPLDITIRHVSDLDGDGVPDVLGFDERLSRWIIHLYQQAPGLYAEGRIDEPVDGMLAAPLSGVDVDVLYWSYDEVFLRRRMDGAWPVATPVTVDGPWARSNSVRFLNADGDTSRELLLQSQTEPEDGYSLWWLEPCA